MRKTGLILAAACGLILTACGQLLSVQEDGCRITAVGVNAKRDANGNQVDVYDFQFVGDSACEGAHVNASYNLGTQEAQEKVSRPGAMATSSWICRNDPWLTSGADCSRIDLKYAGNVAPSQADLAGFERAAMPLSAIPLIPIDRDTLKGQLGNALKRLPSAVIEPPLSDVIGRSRVSDVVSVFPTPTLAPQPPVTGPLLRQNNQGQNVEAIQYLLLEHRIAVEVDGDFGPQTDDAVRAFQRARGLAADGIVGPNTWAALWKTVRKGDPNVHAIQAVQTLLNWHGMDVVVDGDFGDQTDDAVQTFQQSMNLTVDGVVGNRTWTALVNTP